MTKDNLVLKQKFGHDHENTKVKLTIFICFQIIMSPLRTMGDILF